MSALASADISSTRVLHQELVLMPFVRLFEISSRTVNCVSVMARKQHRREESEKKKGKKNRLGLFLYISAGLCVVL